MSNIIKVSAPGRIDLVAGPTDWFGGHALTMAINLRAYATVRKIEDNQKIEITIGDSHAEYYHPEYDGNLDLFKAVIELSGLKGFAVDYHTDIPKGSGLGGSAPLTVATVFALNRLFEKNWSKYYMAELAQRAETYKLKTVNGYQDQYTAMFGGFLYMDFSRKSCQRGDYSKTVEAEPYTTVENLIEYLPDFNIVVAIPEITRTGSDQTNGSVSDRYLNGEKLIIDSYEKMLKLGEQAKKMVVDGNISELYRIINEDNEILRIFGFLTEANEMIIRIAKENGALACRTCGAGRGAVALFTKNQDDSNKIYTLLKEKVAHIYHVKKDEGVRYEK